MTIKICPECRGLVYWNSYFQAYICPAKTCKYFERINANEYNIPINIDDKTELKIKSNIIIDGKLYEVEDIHNSKCKIKFIRYAY